VACTITESSLYFGNGVKTHMNCLNNFWKGLTSTLHKFFCCSWMHDTLILLSLQSLSYHKMQFRRSCDTNLDVLIGCLKVINNILPSVTWDHALRVHFCCMIWIIIIWNHGSWIHHKLMISHLEWIHQSLWCTWSKWS